MKNVKPSKNCKHCKSMRRTNERNKKKNCRIFNHFLQIIFNIFRYSPINRSKLSGLTIWISSEWPAQNEKRKKCFVSINCGSNTHTKREWILLNHIILIELTRWRNVNWIQFFFLREVIFFLFAFCTQWMTEITISNQI